MNNSWLHRFAVLTAVATLALIGIGGVVTSHEAGLSVHDWPTSYGYNMFFFPLSQWWHAGNVFYEHSHRLFASGVGLLTTVLAVWVWVKDSRAWVRWLGVTAFAAVVLQGVLGGLRVVMLKNEIGIFHATLAQLFFVLTCALALFTSRWWARLDAPGEQGCSPNPHAGSVRYGVAQASCLRVRAASLPPVSDADRVLPRLILFTTVLILFQLILGATMRHQHAGLAIPDFPLAYGKLWPAMDPESIAQYNQQRDALTSLDPITPFHIMLQMTHRIVAVLILAAVGLCAWRAWRSSARPVARVALFWFVLILAQAGLGAATVLSQKAADLATAHVLTGALSLATGALLCIICRRSPQMERSPAVSSAEGMRGASRLAARTAA